ncbi:hypothetical protein ACK8GG_19020 [Micromonosporaceae bacterium DT55]|uniref:hypothetical protein n=1 Tax=Melissospora conviva TaxID=3388432 RepID=UPI003C271582
MSERQAAYEAAVAELAALNGRLADQRQEAHGWYAQQCEAAEAAVRAARDRVASARAEVTAAAEQVAQVDREAAELWEVLRRRVRLGPNRLGSPPVPASGAGGDPVALLAAARDLLDRAGRPGELDGSANPLLALAGVLTTVLTFALGLGARALGDHYGGELAVGMPVLALAVTMLGPFAALAPAKVLADRRHAALGPGPVAVVLSAGLVTAATLLLLLR